METFAADPDLTVTAESGAMKTGVLHIHGNNVANIWVSRKSRHSNKPRQHCKNHDRD
jgi:hypothetical protein